MISAEGWVKVLDFGLAKALGVDSGRGDGEMSLAGARSEAPTIEPSITEGQFGTVPYMSPEQVRERAVDVRTDVWAFGCVLFEMLSGRRPFTGASRADLFTAILTEQPPWEALPPALPPAIRELLERCLEKEAESRMGSMTEVRAVLTAVLQVSSALSLSGTAPAWQMDHAEVQPTGGWLRRQRQVRRSPLPISLVAGTLTVLVLVLAIIGGLRWAQWQAGSVHTGYSSVVVMPSRLLNVPDAPYLSDAIPHTISSHLSGVPGLEAKLPPSAADIERLGGDVSRVARAYNAEVMVLSTTSEQHGRLVLDLQLVATESRNLLWSQEYLGDPDDFLDLARRAAEGIRQVLRPEAEGTAVAGRLLADPQAEVLIQQGRYYSNLYRNRGREGDKQRALEAFTGALELAPRHAEIPGEIAVLHTLDLDLGRPLSEVQPEVRTWAEQALKLDSQSSKAWAALGEVEPGDTPDSYRRKLEYLLRAASFGPQDGYAANRLSAPLSYLSFSMAAESSREASVLEPLGLTSLVFESMCLSALGRNDEALARVDHALEIEPGMPFALFTRAFTLAVGNREEEALQLITSRLEPLVADGMLNAQWVGFVRDLSRFGVAVKTGDEATAREAAGRLGALARGEQPFPRWQGATMRIAGQLARHGWADEAVELVAWRSQHGVFQPYEYLLLSPELASVRDDPRFREALVAARSQFDQLLEVFEAARDRGETPEYLEEPRAELLRRIREAQPAA